MYIYIHKFHSHATYSNFLSTENFTTSSTLISKFKTSEGGRAVSLKEIWEICKVCMLGGEVAERSDTLNPE